VEITILVQSIVGLVIILAILLFVLVYPFGKKRKEEKISHKKAPVVRSNNELTFLKDIILNPESSESELNDALIRIIKYHGTIHKKLGMRVHPDSHVYIEVLFKLCRHKNANAKMIVKFSNDLEKLNPQYMREINYAMMRGLNSRGI